MLSIQLTWDRGVIATRSKHNISQPEGMKLFAPTSLLGSGYAKHVSLAKKTWIRRAIRTTMLAKRYIPT